VVRGGLLGAFPRESVGLLVVEVKTLRGLGAGAPWMQEMARIAERGPFREIEERFGRETLNGLDRVGLAIVPQAGSKVAYGIVGEGSFDQEKMREALGGQEILTMIEVEGRPDLSVTILEGGHLGVGPRSVLEVIRTNAARRGSGLDDNGALLGLLDRVRPTSQVWGAVDFKTLASLTQEFARSRGQGETSLTPPQMRSLQSLAFEGTFGRKVDYRLLGVADTEDHAKTLADAARGLIALGRMGASQEGGALWLELLDGISIDQTGLDLNLRGSIAEKTLAALARKAGEAAGPEEIAPPAGAPGGAGSPDAPGSDTTAIAPAQ
jgi:hypothetical protein